MKKEVLREPIFVEEIIEIIRSGVSDTELKDKLADYHENDIAQSLELLDKNERAHLYSVLGVEWMSEILAYVENPEAYIDELGIDKLAAVINEMDADDAVDFLEDIDESVKNKLSPILNEDVKADIRLIKSYDEDEIGSVNTAVFCPIVGVVACP